MTKSATQAAMADAVSLHKTTYLKAQLEAPTLKIPSDPSDPSSTTLILDLGRLNIDTDLQTDTVQNSDAENEKANANERGFVDVLKNRAKLKDYYDTFLIKASDIKVFVDKDIPQNHMLTPVDIDLQFHSCIFPG